MFRQLTPSSLFFDFFVGQAVIVGSDLGLNCCQLLFLRFLPKQLIEECRVGSELSLASLFFDVGVTFGRKGDGAPNFTG